MSTDGTPAEVIDEVLAEYTAKRLSRHAAIAAILSVVDVTEMGAADLLDHALGGTA